MLFLIIILSFLSKIETQELPPVPPCDYIVNRYLPVRDWLEANLSGTYDWVKYNDVVDLIFTGCLRKAEYFEACQKVYPTNATLLNTWNQTLEDYCYFFYEIDCYENHTGWRCLNETMIEKVSGVADELFKEYITILTYARGGSNWKPDKGKLNQIDAVSHKKLCW